LELLLVLRRKSETEKRMLEFILTMRAQDLEKMKFRCDNSPENKRLAEEVEEKGVEGEF
jgi:hypothetical protein